MTRRLVGLDVIRAVCIAGVLTTHFSGFFIELDSSAGGVRRILALGSFGVTGFFLLSAYLLTGILLREIGNRQPQVWKRYWIRRSLRIWPLYYLVFFVTVAVGLATTTATAVAGWPWLATFSFNWVTWRESNVYLMHFWSMSAEEQLYILIPILSFVAFKWRASILLLLIAVAPLLRWFVAGAFPYPAIWNFTTSHLDVFALGVLIASLDHRGGESWSKIRASVSQTRWSMFAVAIIGSALVAAAFVNPAWVFGSRWSAITYLMAAIVWAWMLLLATSRPWTNVNAGTKSAIWMGQRSYGIYVYHWPAVVFGGWLVTVVAIPSPLVGLALLVVVLVVSEASFRWIESPFLRLKTRFSREPAPATWV